MNQCNQLGPSSLLTIGKLVKSTIESLFLSQNISMRHETLCKMTSLTKLKSLGTLILIKQSMSFKNALKTALGMSFISMISMEISMNLTDYFLTGGAILTWWIVPIMLVAGFITPWPYNYWRLKKFGVNCH